MAANSLYKMADDNCPSCGAVPGIFWRDGGSFQTRTVCICGRKTRWVMGGHDAVAAASDDEICEMED